jgi:hypothetical protein
MTKTTQDIISDSERAGYLRSMYVADFNPLRFVDWLSKLRDDAFWYFEDGKCKVPTYTAAERLYIEKVWRSHYKGPEIEEAPTLFDYFYKKFVPLFFLSRRQRTSTGTVSGWGEAGNGSTVEFMPVMDLVLSWTESHFAQLRVLHELDDATYYVRATDEAMVHEVIARVESGSGVAKRRLNEWVEEWLTRQIRYFVFVFCHREGLATSSGGVRPAPAKTQTPAPSDNRPGLAM